MAEVRPEGRVASVEFTGTRTELFVLLFRGYLLLIPTLGIYRFWLTTWKRRFYWQHTVIDGDPLEYTGRALQLLFGFLFALAFFLPLYIAFFFLSTQSADIALLGYGVIGVVFWFMVGYAIYRGRDFRLSRTLWRGIRFNQHGNAWAYALRRFLWSIVMVLTAGLLYPAMASSLWRYRYKHTWYGDRRFRWAGSWKTLAGPFYRFYFLVLALVVGASVVAASSGSTIVDGVAVPAPQAILAFAGATTIIFIAWLAFRAREATRMFSEVRLGDARATVTVRARALVGQYVLYGLSILGLSLVLAIAAMTLAQGAISSGSFAVDLGQMAQSSWLAVLGLILAYLVVLGTFGLLGEVFLGYGYWMLVARGAAFTNADSLHSVRAAGEDHSLAGEGLADALNVGAY